MTVLMTPPAYLLKDLSVSFGSRAVVDVHELALEQGKATAVLGPNGSGKTTLLEVLAFLRKPSQGTVCFEGNGVDRSGTGPTALRRKVVLVPQHPVMFRGSVLKNVEFPLSIRGVGREQRRVAAYENLCRVGMGDFADAKAHTLSGGETQRVAIARALGCGPRAILFDEPTASVDTENTRIIEDIIRGLRSEGVTVVFSTHDRGQAARLATTTVHLFGGKVVRVPDENIFRIKALEECQGGACCILGNGLNLHVAAAGMGKSAWVSLDPLLVVIGPEEAGDAGGALNRLTGTLAQFSAEGRSVRITVDVGFPLIVLSTHEKMREAGLTIGQTVTVRIPPDSVRPI